MPDERIVPRTLARDPYDDVTPCGGARKEIVSESCLVEGVEFGNGSTGTTSPGRHPTHQVGSEIAAYDPRRLERALALKWERMGPGEYRIWGGANEHYLKLDRDPPCDCEDWYWGGGKRRCKHLMLAEMCESTIAANGNDSLLRALQAMLEQKAAVQKEHDEAMRRSRRAIKRAG